MITMSIWRDNMMGRIVGRTVGEIAFRQHYREECRVGEILVADDREKNMLFFLRVVDIHYGQEGPERWGIRTAGDMLFLDSEKEEYAFRGKERRLFNLCLCKPLGYIKNGTFHKPKLLPSHFCAVRRATQEDYAFLERYMGDIEVGTLRSGEDTLEVKVGVAGEFISSHMGVFATTGMGKSNLMRVFAASVMKSGAYGMLIIDPHGEYYHGGEGKGLKHHPLADQRLVVYSPNPSFGMNRLSISAYEIGVADIAELFSTSEAQREALYALHSRFGNRWMVALHETSTEELTEIFNRRIQDVTFSVLKRRAERIMGSDIVHRDENVSVTQRVIQDLHAGKVVLVDTAGLYEYEELLVGMVLARRMLNHNKRMFRDKEKFDAIPPVLIAIEEAQRVLREGIFAQIAREGRKFKVGLCAITQQPKLIGEEVLSQFNTFFILGLADERDRSNLKAAAKQDISGLDNEIQTLEVGEGLITYPGAPFAIPVKVHWYDEYIKSIENENAAKNTMSEKIDDAFY
ncbi:MAG: ATP-binding protein [Thermoplasmata archaeon]|nr:MAG: ATP-binding protein [Thermoplasmata archaeon]